MKIKILLDLKDEWKECWLQTEYLGKEDETFRIWLYPTKWSELYRTEGFCRISWISKECSVPILSEWIYECYEYLNKETIDERPLTAMQKISKFFKRIFSW